MPALVLSVILSSVVPMETLRFKWVHEQQYDYSCGAAALSSLAVIYWNLDADEQTLLDLLPELEKPREYTTLLDLADLAENLGFTTGAYTTGIDALKEAVDRYGPVLAHLNRNDGHFVVVIAVSDTCIVIGDPSEGCVGWIPDRFHREWSRVMLAVFHESTMFSFSSVRTASAETMERMKRLVLWPASW